MKRAKRHLATGLLVASLCTLAHAQDYPNKPVQWIVPFTPGGGSNVVAHIVGNELGNTFGRQFIIDNRAGAAGSLGSTIAAKSLSDGYTLILDIASSLAINVSLYDSSLPYNPAKDSALVSMIMKVPQMILLHPSVTAPVLKQLIELAKADPHKRHYRSGGSGASGHLVVELSKMAASIQFTHNPFKTSR